MSQRTEGALGAAAVGDAHQRQAGQRQTGDRKAGDRRGDFDSLARQHYKQAYGVAYRMTGNHPDAEDLTQEAFLRAFRFFGYYRVELPFDRWFYRILSNQFVNECRRRPKRAVLSLDQPLPGWGFGGSLFLEVPDADADPARAVLARELDERLHLALDRLPWYYRQTVVLADMEGLSYREISDLMGCAVGAVRSRLHRGRQLLRGALSADTLPTRHTRQGGGGGWSGPGPAPADEVHRPSPSDKPW